MSYKIPKSTYLLVEFISFHVITAQYQRRVPQHWYGFWSFSLSEEKVTFEKAVELCFSKYGGRLAVYETSYLWEIIKRILIKNHG